MRSESTSVKVGCWKINTSNRKYILERENWKTVIGQKYEWNWEVKEIYIIYWLKYGLVYELKMVTMK